MREQIRKANASIYQAAQTQAQYAGMGTTLVVCLFYDNRVMVGHLGDSRLYRLRKKKLMQITRDHSLLQEQIDAGLITPEQAKTAAHKNLVITSYSIHYTKLYDNLYNLALDFERKRQFNKAESVFRHIHIV